MPIDNNSSDLDSLVFENRFVQALPADPQKMNLTRPVHGACFSWVQPDPVRAPELIAHSKEVADMLGLGDETVQSQRFADVFTGNEVLEHMLPFAMAYGGHQFGSWAGQLGDGRAINLGEVRTASGELLTLQLKGAGPTPYSRTADGRAVLRSSVREFLCSEAMFHLGVPTTRALSLTLSGEAVMRDMFYDGHPKDELGAVVCRVAPSFVRFGSFQLPASRGELDVLRALADHTIQSDFPHLLTDDEEPSAETYAAWFREVGDRTADMIVNWMRVGFVHGVMNTDNMSILGQTIDYGPYGWLENYDAGWTPNTTDAGRARYAFGQQPQIGFWNLVQLGNALVPLVEEVAPLQEIIESYQEKYDQKWRVMMGAKLGLPTLEGEEGKALGEDLLSLLGEVETDMTIFFRQLARVEIGAAASGLSLESLEPLEAAFYIPKTISEAHRMSLLVWAKRYQQALEGAGITQQERAQTMNATNPKYVLRNYLAQLAIDKSEQGDHSMIAELLELLRNPFDEQPEFEHYAALRPDWARDRPGCSMLSCSS
ncbi:MAG: YdiU family protein [Planctomycetota bacterium]|nr:YdiU family protein [Planctomycetota bacterium]